MSQISKKQQFKEKSARALNDKQPPHPQNLDHKNEAQQQEMSQKSTEEDPTELKLLVQEANRLKAMYREDPKSVDPLSIAQIYAFILEERAKKQVFDKQKILRKIYLKIEFLMLNDTHIFKF